jgi:hypothetical protein
LFSSDFRHHARPAHVQFRHHARWNFDRFSCTYDVDDPTKLAISVGVRGPGQTSVVSSSSSFISIQTTGNEERRQTPMLDPTRLASDEEPGRQKEREHIAAPIIFPALTWRKAWARVSSDVLSAAPCIHHHPHPPPRSSNHTCNACVQPTSPSSSSDTT